MKVLKFIEKLVFPQKCASCFALTENDEVFCEKCIPEIPFVEGETCEKCGIALSPEFPSPICVRCRENEFVFDRNFPLMEHVGHGRDVIINMKYNRPSVIPDMARLIADRLKEEGISADVVTFVPELKREEVKKGLALTYLLSRELAKLLCLPHEELLRKTRKTEKQKELTAKQRVLNVKNAYEATEELFGRTVILIDDVFTTGATMNECAKTLKNAGAAEVYTATVGIRDRE